MCRLFATVQNTDTTREKFLRPLGGLHSFFNRYRATVGGKWFKTLLNTTVIVSCLKVQIKNVNEMDDIESSANPSFDDDYHKYANGLNNFIDYTTSEQLMLVV